MSPEANVEVFQRSLQVLLLMISFILVPALVVGLVISMFQAATQINEMTLSFIPKLLAMLAALAILGPWMVREMIDFTRNLLGNLPWMIG